MIDHLKRSLSLVLLMVCGFLGVSAQTAELAEGYYRIISQRTNQIVTVQNHTLGYLSEHSNTSGNNASDLSYVWKVKRIGNTYWIVNAQEHLAIQQQNRLNVSFTTGTYPATYYIKKATKKDFTDNWLISTNADFSGNTLWHNGASGLVQNWNGTENENNFWKFEAVDNEVKAQVKPLEDAWQQLEKSFKEMLSIKAGGLFRVKNAQQHYWTENLQTHAVSTTTQTNNSTLNNIWIVAANEEGITLRNAATGRFVVAPNAQNGVTTSTASATIFFNILQHSPNYYQLGTNANFPDGSCFVENGQNNIVGGNSSTNNAPNPAADWQLVPVTDVTEAQVRQAIQENARGVYAPEEGKYYVVRSVNYPSRVLSMTRDANRHLEGLDRNEDEMSQVWRFTKMGDKWGIQSVVDQRYVSNDAGRSQDYTMVETAAPFTLQLQDKWLPKLAFVGSNGGSLHCANSQSYHIVNWDASSAASHWQLEEVTIDPAQLERYKQDFKAYDQLVSKRTLLNAQLQQFFDDYACTQLKSAYRNMSDKDFTAALTAAQLPQVLIDMALRVKNDTWNAQNADANRYEKRFRIDEYQAYSHPQKWASDLNLMPTSFGQYSQLTNPTGITVSEKQYINIFVDQDVPANCELKAEMVQGKNTTGTTYPLHKGLNTVFVQNTAHLYINYVINDVNLKYTDQPKIRIHVEGGRANGYHDSQKDSNADWDKLRQLKAYGFLNDDVVRLKSKHTIHSLSLKGIEEQQDKGNWMYNGEYKGINGVLGKWDWINEMERDFFSPERFTNRFNCLLFNTDAAGLYATNYGTFLGTVSTTFSYNEYANGGDSGNIWPVAHETGHHYQKLINLQRCMESSNNLWSNMALWKRGSTVSRGDALQQLINRYNNGQSWFDMTISDRMRMYWQLWLYYEELSHHPGFFRQLFDKFRANPIDMSNAKTDYLRFAQFCSEVAQEDLTEFFTFYGFFRKVGENIPMKYNDSFYDGHYAPAKMSVSQADIDACKTAMAAFPKKASNLLFIDERIRPVPATYEGVTPGTMRRGLIGTPGDASIYGDVGHYIDYGVMNPDGSVKEAPTVAQPKAVQLDGRTVRIQGTGAVGYKVLDDKGNLVMVSNQNTFDLPSNIDLNKLTVVVGGGDGETVEVIKNGEVKPEYDKQVAPPANTTDLAVSISPKHAKGKYFIRNFSKYDGKFYYADAQTHPTADRNSAGQFLWVAGNHSGEFYLYSLGNQKWAKLSDRNEGSNKIQWVAERGKAQKWNLQKVHKGTSAYYDVTPSQDKNKGWNWHGGIGNKNNTLGLYKLDDNNSHWQFLPADAATEYHALVMHADSLAKQDEPKVNLTRRQLEAFQQLIEAGKNRTDATEADVTALKEEIARWKAWTKADRLLQTPPFGKPEYTQFRVPFKEFLDNTPLATTTAARINEYNDYFQQILQIDSLVALTNPGYPLAKVFETPSVLNRFMGAAKATTPTAALKDQMTSAYNKWINDAKAHKFPTDADAYHLPEDGKVYRLRSFYDNRFVTSAAPSAKAQEKLYVSLSKAEDNSTLWVVQTDASGKQYLAAANGAGYLSRVEADYYGALRNTPAAFTFGTGRLLNKQKFGTLYLRTEGLSLVAAQNDNHISGVDQNLGATEANPLWERGNKSGGTYFFFDTVTDAAFTVTTHAGSNGNYATLQLPFAAELPAGLTAYALKEIANKEVGNDNGDKEMVLEPIEGHVLPANTPVILSSERAGKFELRPTTWHAPLPTKLSGTNLPLLASKRSSGTKYYALTIDDDSNELLFRQVESDVDIPGNRAFFTLPLGASAARSLFFRVVPTSVKTAAAKQPQSRAIFNLAGQRINAKDTHGVVIQQGQKMIIR